MVSIKPLRVKATNRRVLHHGRDFSHLRHEIPAVNRRLSKEYKQHTHWDWKKRLWYVWVLVPLLLLVVVLNTPWFTVKNVIINGVSSGQTEQKIKQIVYDVMSERRWWLLPQSNIFYFNSQETRQRLGREFYSQSLVIRRHWPNVLKLDFMQSLIVARWLNGNKIYALDNRGVLVQELSASDTGNKSLISIKEAGVKVHDLGETVVAADVVGFLKDFYQKWQDDLNKLPFDYVLLDSGSLPTVQIYSGNWYVYVSVREDVAEQITALKRLLNEKIGRDMDKLQYIDVRFGSRLYYKLK